MKNELLNINQIAFIESYLNEISNYLYHTSIDRFNEKKVLYMIKKIHLFIDSINTNKENCLYLINEDFADGSDLLTDYLQFNNEQIFVYNSISNMSLYEYLFVIIQSLNSMMYYYDETNTIQNAIKRIEVTIEHIYKSIYIIITKNHLFDIQILENEFEKFVHEFDLKNLKVQ